VNQRRLNAFRLEHAPAKLVIEKWFAVAASPRVIAHEAAQFAKSKAKGYIIEL